MCWDSKKTWTLLKMLCKSQKLSKLGDKTIDLEMANVMKEHFVTVSPKLNDAMSAGRALVPMTNDPNTSFHFAPIDPEEVTKLLRGLSASKSCGIDGLMARLIKACGPVLICPLTYIYNLSLSHCIFPTIWKAARVMPLFKEGSQSECSNYRPISVLPILSKMLERLVHNRVYGYITSMNMLNKCQAGFRKRNSTGTCLIKVLNETYSNMDSGRLTGVLFLDLPKAFDTIDHKVAICKLSDVRCCSVLVH